ncbi:MAG: hypothetical protein RSB71_03515 [Bacilli bacterium]
MKNLYIDFDGVIMDTIRVTYDMLDRLEIDKKDYEKMSEFYANLNWKQLLLLTPIINDGFNCLKTLYNSKKFNIAILTHVNSLDEAVAKINHIRKYFKDITIIPVPREVVKTKMISAKDAILVDDYSGNLEQWKKEGGIGIQFATDLSKDKGFKVIDKLDKLIDLF